MALRLGRNEWSDCRFGRIIGPSVPSGVGLAFQSLLDSIDRQRCAKTLPTAASDRVVAVSRRGTTCCGRVSKTSASEHTDLIVAPRISRIDGRLKLIHLIAGKSIHAVLAPFQHVSMQIEESECIGCQFSHGMGTSCRVTGIPACRRQFGT